MCDRPILIDNPYRGLSHVGLNFLHDTKSLKISVPCGNCRTCISLRQCYYVQRCQMESLDHHLFMLTLTYRDKYIPFTIVNDRKLYYPDWSDVQKMLKRLRNRGLKFSYMFCSEYGSRHHRPHFHAIISVPKGVKDNRNDIRNLEEKLQNMFLGEWRRNYGSDKKPIYKDLCEKIFSFRGRTFDLHYIDPVSTANGEQDVAFYVTKYIFKADKWVDRLKSALKLNLPHDEFIKVWKLLRPHACISKSFGSPQSPNVIAHIRKGIDFSRSSNALFPFFINPLTGATFPLAPYYQRKFITLDDAFFFFVQNHGDSEDATQDMELRNLTKERLNEISLNEIRHIINSRLTNYDFNYDSKIKNFSSETFQEDTCFSDCDSPLPDDWQSDFGNSF